jgi:phasin family protein
LTYQETACIVRRVICATQQEENMSIVEQLNGAAGRVRETVRDYRHQAAEEARKRADLAAQIVDAARTPVDTLVSAGQRLNDLTHEAFGKLLSQNAVAIDGLITGGVERLQLFAKTEDLKSFVRRQAALNPATRERVSKDLRQMWAIAARAGRDMGALASETYAELIHGVKTRARPVIRKTVRRATKKTQRARRAH